MAPDTPWLKPLAGFWRFWRSPLSRRAAQEDRAAAGAAFEPAVSRDGAEADWAAVRAAYEAGAETLAAIQARFGVRRDELRARRDAEGWQRRPTDAAGLARLRRMQRLARLAAELEAGEAAEAPVDWQAVRQAYEEGETPLGEIRRRFGLTERQLRDAREAGGWATRPQVATPRPREGDAPRRSEKLAERLGRALEAETARHERAARARLARALERLRRLERAEDEGAEAPAGGRGGQAKRAQAAAPDEGQDPFGRDYDQAHVHWMREELKRRLRILAAARRDEEARKTAAAGGEEA